MTDRIPLYSPIITVVPVTVWGGRFEEDTVLPAGATGVLLDYLGDEAGIVELGIDSDGVPDGLANVLLCDIAVEP